MGDLARSVLVVEDEQVVALDICELLNDLGYPSVGIASNSDDALANIASSRPALVLMDIRIQGSRDGIDTAHLVRDNFNIPVVFLTAHSDDATIARAKLAAPYGYTHKPIKPALLRSAIEIALHHHDLDQRLAARRRWFATTLEAISDAVLTVDLAGRIKFMNPAAEVLTGVTAERAVGRPAGEIVDLVDPRSLASVELPIARVMAEQIPITIGEVALVARDRSRRLVSDRFAPVATQRTVLGAVMVFRDITEQKIAQQQLELADRLASLGTLAAGVAHEINNPLAVIAANAHIAAVELADLRRALSALDTPSGKEMRELCNDLMSIQTEIDSAGQRIAKIVADLREFSHPAQRDQDVLHADIHRAMAWAIRSTAPELRHRAALICDVPQLPAVRCDEIRLGQVFVNLLINAAHAIAPGHVSQNSVSITAEQHDRSITICVRDTGCGIPRELVGRVYEPFFTTKPVGKGSGLGLSICHGIITSCGGTLRLESNPGQGTTCFVTLPVATATPSEAREPLEARMPPSGVRILAVDDEPLVLRTLQRMLREHELVGVGEAREVIARIRNGERFDAILVDVMMPEMTGMELYQEVLRVAPDEARKIIFISGGVFTAEVETFLRSVPNDLVGKPFDLDALRRSIARVLAAAHPRAET